MPPAPSGSAKTGRTIPDTLVRWATGEWMLTPSGRPRRANGGTIVFLRTAWSALLIYVVAATARGFFDPCLHVAMALDGVAFTVFNTLPWLGAIFAGVYVTYSTRFGSQWTYLAGVYNQIKSAELATAANPTNFERTRVLGTWKAGFIEDAYDLHLSTKPIFASIIDSWANDDGVREAFVHGDGVHGAERFDAIVRAAREAWNAHIGRTEGGS